MALSATIDATTSPMTLTVVSDARHVEVEVRTGGETITATGARPVSVVDADQVWTVVSDDGATAVYSAP